MLKAINFSIRAAVAATAIGLLSPAGAPAQPYFPNMVYHPVEEIAEGVTWQRASHSNRNWQIHIITVDLENRNLDLQPVHKQATALERTSVMAERVDGIAAINAGFFNTASPFNSVSYTRIDGVAVSPNAGSTRSVFGLWGNHNSKIVQTPINGYTPDPPNPDWSKVINAIGGLGSFTTSNGTVTGIAAEDAPWDAQRHPRTIIGTREGTRKVFLITIDGRTTASVGMNFTEMAQLLADLNITSAVNMDGGGSTTAWVEGQVVNVPSDGPGNERSVVSAWVVVPSYTIDNTDEEVTATGSWTTITTSGNYNGDALRASGGSGANTVTWRPNLEPPLGGESSFYKVYAWWVSNPAYSPEAPYTISHKNGTDTVTVNQTQNGGSWNLLGTYEFDAGDSGFVRLSDNTPQNRTVSADAVRFVQVKRMEAKWRKDVGDFPWFQEDNNTRGFAFNPATGNVIATSYTAEGGVFALSHSSGDAIRLSGSADLVGHLAFTSAAATRTGKVFVSNLATEAGTNNSRVFYWPSENAAEPVTLTANAPARIGDYMDAYEDPAGNVTVLVSGAQGSPNPVLLRWYYDAAQSTWSNSTVQTSGSPASPGNKRIVTIAHEGGSSYEIWLRDLTGSHFRFSSNGVYLGDSFPPGTRIQSNYYFSTDPDTGQTVRYIAAGGYSSTSGAEDIVLYNAANGKELVRYKFAPPNVNGNASGRLGVGAHGGEMFVAYGMTNNAIMLLKSTEPALAAMEEPSGLNGWLYF